MLLRQRLKGVIPTDEIELEQLPVYLKAIRINDRRLPRALFRQAPFLGSPLNLLAATPIGLASPSETQPICPFRTKDDPCERVRRLTRGELRH